MSITSNRLKELREMSDLTQAQVAEELGLSLSGYRKYEYGEREINISLLRDFAMFYNVTADYLVGLSNLHNDLQSKALTVILARNEMLSNEIIYNEMSMKSEGQTNASVTSAYKTFIQSQGFYNKVLYEYINDFFNQSNPKPEQDTILEKKYPISFDIQEDLFLGVNVNVTCADGYQIGKVKQYVGGYSLDINTAIAKAEKYIAEKKVHLRLE